jgi:hypothetical protein
MANTPAIRGVGSNSTSARVPQALSDADRRWRTSFVILIALLALVSFQMSMAANETAEELAKLPPKVDAARGLVVARPFIVASNVTGGVLRLPDGSVIRTVWPAALELSPLGNGEPVWPRCEPAVYSLARMSPEGKVIWAKSYVYYWKENLKYEECMSEVWGFSIRSPLGEVTKPGYYRVEYDNRFFVGDPNELHALLVLDAGTGGVAMEKPPRNLRVMDAYQLQTLKYRIDKDIERQMPPSAEKSIQTYTRIYKKKLFRRLQKAIFPKEPPSDI